MKRLIVSLLVLLLAVPLAGCSESAVSEETTIYSVQSQIQSLQIQVGAADLIIRHAESLQVESNLKYLTVKEDNGWLRIVDEKTTGVTYNDPVLTLYIPADMTFDRIEITTGAAKLTADRFSVNTLKLQLGAGDTQLQDIHVHTWMQVYGGAGKISLADCRINNLTLQMGVGALDMTAALYGDSELTLGLGKSDITLLGERTDYRLDIEKGLGSLIVDGQQVEEYETDGNGPNEVELQGGLGEIRVDFKNTEE